MAQTFDIAAHIKSHSELTLDELSLTSSTQSNSIDKKIASKKSVSKDATADADVNTDSGDGGRESRRIPRDEMVHFKASIDIAQFIAKGHDTQEKIDAVMKDILLGAKENGYRQREKKRVDTLKNGEKVQRYRDRLITLDDTLSAYHSRDVNNDHTVEPHFHVLADKNKRFGKGYSGLTRMFQQQADRYGLVLHFAEESKNSASSNLQQNTSKLSWQIQENSDERLSDYIHNNSDELHARLDLLEERVRQDGNIQFYIKTMTRLQERLRGLGLSFVHNDKDIAFDYDLPLSKEQMQQLDILASGDKAKVQTLLDDRSSILARDYIKTMHGFNSSIIESINRSSLPWNIPFLSPADLDFRGMNAVKKDSFASIETNEDGGITVRGRKGMKKVGGFAPFLQASADDMRQCAKYATNEKEFRSYLEKMGYKKVGFRTKDKKRIGIKYQTKGNKQRQLYFDKLGLTWDELDKTMLSNRKRLDGSLDSTLLIKGRKAFDASESIPSAKASLYPADVHINDHTFTVYSHALLLVIGDPSQVRGTSTHHKALRDLGYRISYDRDSAIIKDNKGTRVREKGSSLVIDSKGDPLDEALTMLNIAQAKGWDLTTMEIKGNNDFIAACMKLRSKVTAKGAAHTLLQNLYH